MARPVIEPQCLGSLTLLIRPMAQLVPRESNNYRDSAYYVVSCYKYSNLLKHIFVPIIVLI